MKNLLKTTIDTLYETIDFLKEEIIEKNLLIRTLTYQYANYEPLSLGGPLMNSSVQYEEKTLTDPDPDITGEVHYAGNSQAINYTEHASQPRGINKENGILIDESTDINNEQVENSNGTEKITEEVSFQELYNQWDVFNRKEVEKEDNLMWQLNEVRRKMHEQFTGSIANRFEWEQYSSGVARKTLDKMGYRGKGLGKNQDGIAEAIQINASKGGITNPKIKNKENTTRKIIYILSDSMLKGMDDERLSNQNYEIRRYCHGGCTIKCMLSHVNKLMQCKPEYVLLNIGTNDCVNNTSDEVLKELLSLKEHIEKKLPSTTVIISLPTVRMDSAKANVIIRNLNTKLKKLNMLHLDNANLQEHHLGKKGLHFNDHGTKKMASNIISFIKRL